MAAQAAGDDRDLIATSDHERLCRRRGGAGWKSECRGERDQGDETFHWFPFRRLSRA